MLGRFGEAKLPTHLDITTMHDSAMQFGSAPDGLGICFARHADPFPQWHCWLVGIITALIIQIIIARLSTLLRRVFVWKSRFSIKLRLPLGGGGGVFKMNR